MENIKFYFKQRIISLTAVQMMIENYKGTLVWLQI